MRPSDRSLLDTDGECQPPEGTRLPRPDLLEKHSIGLLHFSNPSRDVFPKQLAEHLQELGTTVERYRKPPFTTPAAMGFYHETTFECDAVMEAPAH